MADAPSEPRFRAQKTRGHRRVRRIIVRALYVAGLLVATEVGARLFWFARGATFLTAPTTIYRSFYPEVAAVERAVASALTAGESARSTEDECFRVLLLGASVLNNDYGDVEHVLRERLTRTLGGCVRVHNVSAPAHTSLDSYYKYRHLSNVAFDLVIFYQGINELRAGNCPPERFRADYGHFGWYRLINAYERCADGRMFALPFTVQFVAGKVADRLGWSGALPVHRPDARSRALGCDIKTVPSFRRNIERIVALAAERQQRIMLATFAYYIPDDYSEERFQRRALDYTIHMYPVELWGNPECIRAGLEAHNDAVRAVANEHPGVLLADAEKLIPREGRYFNDACHLTHEGCARLADVFVGALETSR